MPPSLHYTARVPILHVFPTALVGNLTRSAQNELQSVSSKTGYSMSSLPVPTPQIHQHTLLLKLADAATDTRTAEAILIEASLFPPEDVPMLLLESLLYWAGRFKGVRSDLL